MIVGTDPVAPASSATEMGSAAQAGLDEIAIRKARVDFAAVHRIVVHENMHEGTWNHFSCKVPGRPGHLFITPGQTHFSRVTASSLVEVGPTGRPVGREGRLNVSAWAIHHPIQRARPDIVCALHVHGPYSTALASIDGWRFDERGSQNAAVFYGNCAYFGYEGLVTESDEGERMARPDTELLLEGIDWRRAAGEGEDYELLFTASGAVPPSAADVPITAIGRVGWHWVSGLRSIG